jgi:hypothetical protein
MGGVEVGLLGQQKASGQLKLAARLFESKSPFSATSKRGQLLTRNPTQEIPIPYSRTENCGSRLFDPANKKFFPLARR